MYEELFAAVKRENVLRAIQPLESLGCRPAVPVKRMAHRPQDIADIAKLEQIAQERGE
jgi:hypothetical protein